MAHSHRDQMWLRRYALLRGRSYTWLREAVRRPIDPLPTRKYGRLYRVTIAQADAWLERQSTRPGLDLEELVERIVAELHQRLAGEGAS